MVCHISISLVIDWLLQQTSHQETVIALHLCYSMEGHLDEIVNIIYPNLVLIFQFHVIFVSLQTYPYHITSLCCQRPQLEHRVNRKIFSNLLPLNLVCLYSSMGRERSLTNSERSLFLHVEDLLDFKTIILRRGNPSHKTVFMPQLSLDNLISYSFILSHIQLQLFLLNFYLYFDFLHMVFDLIPQMH